MPKVEGERMEQSISIKAFLDGDGKVKQLPQKQRVRFAVLAYLAERFEYDRIYTEKEVNAILEEAHTFGDYFLLRRELAECSLLCRKRDGSAYWREPRALPTDADAQPGSLPE
jgi:hypothetical protein